MYSKAIHFYDKKMCKSHFCYLPFVFPLQMLHLCLTFGSTLTTSKMFDRDFVTQWLRLHGSPVGT